MINVNDLEFISKKIISFIYLQPEISVSINKILGKFKWLQKDELDSILKNMEKEGFIELTPKNSFSGQIVGEINDETGKYTKIENGPTIPTKFATHATLTLKGKNCAEEKRALVMKCRKEFYAKPIINSIISGIIGLIIGYFIGRLNIPQ